MAEDSKEIEDEIHRLDTVPPPPGGEDEDDDAYSAETKVGRVPSEAWSAMMLRSKESEAKLAVARPFPSAPSAGSERRTPVQGIPSLAGEADEDQPTRMGQSPHFPVVEGGVPPLSTAPPMPPLGATPLPSEVALPANPPVPALELTTQTNEAAWPFAPDLVSSPQRVETRKIVVLGIASFVVALLFFGAIAWLWR